MKAVACLLVVVFALMGVMAGPGISFSNSNIQYVGRTELNAAGTSRDFAWSGVAINFRVTGTTSVAAWFTMYGGNIYFNVFVDGVRQSSDLLINAYSFTATSYTVVSGLTTGEHTISLVRRNEASEGIVQFLGLTLSSGGSLLTPPARPTRRIEFIGDSITAGFGNLGTDPCEWSYTTQDFYWSHASITARNLGAELNAVAWSGKGVVRNSGEATQTSAYPLPSMYQLTLGNQTTYGRVSTKWDFSQWIPHAVFINLGTNDYSNPAPADATTYKSKYVDFINTIQSKYNNQPTIFIACGPMSSAYCQYAQDIALSVGATYVYLYGLNAQPRGCQSHPSKNTQIRMAAIQTAYIGNVMGWDYNTTTVPTAAKTIVYDDTTQNLWEDWSWNTHNIAATAVVQSGSYSISLPLTSYAALSLNNPRATFYLTAYASLTFSVYAPAGTRFQVVFLDSNGAASGTNVYTTALAASNTWTTITINTADAAFPSTSLVRGFNIQYLSGTDTTYTAYFDNIFFTAN